jgi:DNA mismatch repair protein MutS
MNALDIITAKQARLTPMMAQYISVKEQYQEMLLFYRMGDFYEMFFHDAEVASEALNIALTHRGKIEDRDIAMCGVPVHALDGYLNKLIQKGFKVAICEQSETPEAFKKRGGKGPLPRDVVRVVTPGTLQEDGLLQANQHNFLAAIGRVSAELAIAWADMSTGDFFVQLCSKEDIETILTRLQAAELIYADDLTDVLAFAETDIFSHYHLSAEPSALFDHKKAAKRLSDFYGVSTLQGFGHFTPPMLSAAGGLLAYLQRTQLQQMPRLSRLTILSKQAFMDIDAATRKSLEITQTLSGERVGSLLHAIDFTRTAAGARLLHSRISAPLTDRKQIELRLGLASWFSKQPVLCKQVSDYLKLIPDLARSLSRIASGRGGPRDLAGLAEGLRGAKQIAKSCLDSVHIDINEEIGRLCVVAQIPSGLSDQIFPALGDDLPILVRDGGFIRKAYCSQLDQLRQMRDESRRLIAGLQSDYAEKTDISSLKIKHNNVLGYHIEVRAAHGKKLLENENFIHRQTTAQAVRFTTTALSDLERQLSTAADRAIALEIQLFRELSDKISQNSGQIAEAAHGLACLDVAQSTARLAERHNFIRPLLTDDAEFTIEAGRHTVVEQALPASSPFIANDCRMSKQANLWLLTGPNMAGKSTYLRQNAHIAILAQAGLFVPASMAEIGIIDKLFSRVGASDDLARGQSTFMVEMVETAAILNQSTDKSLVILDEIGRGTATWDGLAIAWACIEHLHNKNRCRTLFATHYHELTTLHSQLDRLRIHAMLVREWKGDIVFLHQVAAGAAAKSYGVHVAKLAGLPLAVIQRAATLVQRLEGQSQNNNLTDMLPLFGSQQSEDKTYPSSDHVTVSEQLGEMLDTLEPDACSPREALKLLYDLKAEYDKSDN